VTGRLFEPLRKGHSEMGIPKRQAEQTLIQKRSKRTWFCEKIGGSRVGGVGITIPNGQVVKPFSA